MTNPAVGFCFRYRWLNNRMNAGDLGLLGPRNLQEGREMSDDKMGFKDAAEDAMDRAKDKAGEMADAASEKAGELIDDVKGAAAEVAAGSEDVTEDLTEAARQAVEGIEKPE